MKLSFLLMNVTLACGLALSACSSNRLTMPKGNWQSVNQEGFIPANTKRFIKHKNASHEDFEKSIEAQAEKDATKAKKQKGK